MSKFCQNCGTENEDNATFCKSCGTALVVTNSGEQANQANYQNNMNNQGMNNYQYNMNNQPNLNLVPNRNIVMCIVLSVLTCGIYNLYWIATMTDDANKVANTPNDTSGGMTVLLGILTCGIYLIYWYYKQGQRLYQAGKNYSVDIKDNSIPYLILSIIGFNLISEILIQADLNKFSNGN